MVQNKARHLLHLLIQKKEADMCPICYLSWLNWFLKPRNFPNANDVRCNLCLTATGLDHVGGTA